MLIHSCVIARLHIQQRLSVSVQHVISANKGFYGITATVTTGIDGTDGLLIYVVHTLFYDAFGGAF